jgi:hypothetical protein
MNQLNFDDIEYYFKLDFWIYSRYTENFKLKSIPNIEEQNLMVQIYFHKNNLELLTLKEKFWLTSFELRKSNYLDEDYNF